MSNTTAALRAGAGCADSDSNSADFANGAPAPRNSAAPLFPCANPIASCPASLPAPVGACRADEALRRRDRRPRGERRDRERARCRHLLAGFVPAGADGEAGSVFLAGGHRDRDRHLQRRHRFSNADATPQSATWTVPVTVADPTPSARIRDIQGAAHLSPLNGQPVRATCPASSPRVRNNGFYMQDPEPDADDATSEGDLRLHAARAPTVSVGDAVLVGGTVVGVPRRRRRRPTT